MPNFLLDATDPEVLTVAARQIPFPGGVLQDWLPNITRRDHRYRFFRGDRAFRRATPVRPWNTPAVPLERGEFSEVTGRMLPMSNIMWLLEDESQLLDVARANGDDQQVAAIFGQDIVTQTRSILQRVMLMQAEAIVQGRVTIGTQADPENGLQLGSVEFGVETPETAGTLWDAATPGILGQIREQKTAYKVANGGTVEPAVMVISQRIFDVMMADEELRAVFGTTLGTPTTIGEDQVSEVLRRRNLPEIIVDDTEVMDITGTMQRLIPDNRVVFLPPRGTPVGQTQWGVTEEAKKLARARAISDANTPGLVIVPVEEENPVQTGTLASAIAMPVVTQPDLVRSYDVLAAS